MSKNVFKLVQDRYEQLMPDDLEGRFGQQIDAIGTYTNIFDTFGPRAIDAALKMIGGDLGKSGSQSEPGAYYDDEPDWRFPPGFHAPGR